MIRRQLHNETHTFLFGRKRIAENLVDHPHHQEHEQEDRHHDEESAGAAKQRNGDSGYHGKGCRAGNRPAHGDGQHPLSPIIYHAGTGGACNGAAKTHEEWHDGFALQTNLGHGVVEQERDAGQITGLFHQIEAQSNAQHKRRHHQRKIQHIDEHIADEGNEQWVNGDRLHTAAQYAAEGRQQG